MQRVTGFRRACELWDGIAGPEDLAAFGHAFDELIAGLTEDQLDQVGRLVELLHSGRGQQRKVASEVRTPAKLALD